MGQKTIINDFFTENENNIIFTKNGDYVFAFAIDFPPRYSLSIDQIEDMYNSWIRSLKCLPVYTYIVKTDVYKKLLFDEDLGDNSYIQQQNTEYFKGKPFLNHKSYLFIVFSSETMKSKQMRNPFALHSKNTNKITNTEKLKTTVEEFRRSLSSANITVREIGLNEVLSFSVEWWNGLQDDAIYDTVCNEDHIAIGTKRAGIVAITNELNFPDELSYITKDITYSKELDEFTFFKGLPDGMGLSLNFDHIYTQIIRIEDKEEILDKMVSNQKNLYGLRGISYMNADAAQKLGDYLKELKDRDQTALGFAACHTNVLFFADNEYEFKSRLEDVKEQMKILALPYVPTGKRLQNLFFNTFFANISCLDEDSLYLVTNDIAALQIINNSDYKGDNVGIIFQDRIDQKPIKYDLRDEKLQKGTSRGYIIFSPTGAGKSVLENVITTGLADLRYPLYDIQGKIIGEEGVVSVIVDCGESYEKTLLAYPAEDVVYFKYVKELNMGLNPFYLIDGIFPSELRIEDLCEVVWLIIRQGKEVTPVEKTSLRAIIKAYYVFMQDQENLSEVTFPSFYQFIKEGKEDLLKILKIKDEYFNIDEFLHNGKNFTTGIYKNLFAENPELVKSFVNKKIICFELAAIKENELVLSIMILIINTVLNQIVFNDQTKAQVVFDEFAQLLQKGNIFSSVAYMAQTIRKYNGAMGLILQRPSQMPDGAHKANILGNTNTIFVLPVDKKEVAKEIVTACGLSANDHAMIRSLKHNFKGERPYSEVFIHSNASMVARVELPPRVLPLYQTNSEDSKLVLNLYSKNNNNMEVAIEEYLKVKQIIKSKEL